MKAVDYQTHSDLVRRVIERYRATEAPDEALMTVLEMLRHEYEAAPQIMPVDPA